MGSTSRHELGITSKTDISEPPPYIWENTMTTIDPKLRKALTGISGILVTPFDAHDKIAPERLKPIIDRAITAGVHILVVNGNTGEFDGLTTAEAETMVKAVAEQIGGRFRCWPVSAAASAMLAHWPAPRGGWGLGSDGAPAAGSVCVAARRDRLCRAGRRGGRRPAAHALSAQRRHRTRYDRGAVKVEGVAGVKWASPTPLRLAEAIRRSSPDIVWVGGLAETWAPPLCAVGARGFTSGLINVWPEHSVAIHAALEAGDYARANALIDVMLDFEEIRAEEQNGANVTAVKAALQLMGEDCGPTRPPSAWPLMEGQMARLHASCWAREVAPARSGGDRKRQATA